MRQIELSLDHWLKLCTELHEAERLLAVAAVRKNKRVRAELGREVALLQYQLEVVLQCVTAKPLLH